MAKVESGRDAVNRYRLKIHMFIQCYVVSIQCE